MQYRRNLDSICLQHLILFATVAAVAVAVATAWSNTRIQQSSNLFLNYNKVTLIQSRFRSPAKHSHTKSLKNWKFASHSTTSSYHSKLYSSTLCNDLNDHLHMEDIQDQNGNTMAETQPTILPSDCYEVDTYNGVIIRIPENSPYILNPSNLDSLSSCFESHLTNSLHQWRQEGRRGIWIYIPTLQSSLIPICTKLGFDFHSAQPGTLILTQWLPTNTPSRLPSGPTHQVGIGAIVLSLDDHDTQPHKPKILVVQERTGPAAAWKLWKIPTGLVDSGEDWDVAASRELREETGLHGTVDRIVALRQAHLPGNRGSDVFVICLMKLLSSQQQILIPQEEEIAAIQWMDFEEFCNQPIWLQSVAYQTLHQAIRHAIQNPNVGMKVQKLEVGIRPGNNLLLIPPTTPPLK
jgi:ADP-ribose pyrophosphatase YjhB (NUDIX family)